jgi:serine/threonine-protein kinase
MGYTGFVSAETSHLPTRTLGRYAMYEQFAAGGMATLHYGRLQGPSGFSRTVAIKRLHAHLSEDPDFVAMFLDEARLAARIHHPNVIQTLDVVSSEGELFVVLDYVHGDSFSRLLREARRLNEPATPALVGTILFGALEGLHAAHEARDAKGQPLDLVHRDVSPHNILVGTDGIARVLDFGVAKARGRAQTTQAGQLKGKLSYMAPEQLRGQVTRRTDVFAASVVLWEALTGVRLFQGDDEGEIIDKLLFKSIPSPRKYAHDVSVALESVVMRGLERAPKDRFATARDMAIALENQAALGTPIEVGAWVERVAGVTLAQRAERVAAIEAESPLSGDPDRPSAAPPRPRPMAKSLTGATSPTVAVPGLAEPEEREPHDTLHEVPDAARDLLHDAPHDAPGTGIATVSEVRVPRRSRLVGALSAVGVATAIGALLLVRAGPSAKPGAAAVVPQPSASTAGSEDAPPASSAAVPPPAPSDSPAAEVGSEAKPAPVDPPRRGPVFFPAPARKRAACSPPYTLDARGVRHYKPECL